MNTAKVIVRRGDAVDEYPLPLPMIPTYREMNLIRKLTDLSMNQILMGVGQDDDADFAVAVYAIKRENPLFDRDDGDRLFDLPRGAIEIHWGVPDDEPAGADPQPSSGSDDTESSGSAKEPPSSPEPTSETHEESGSPE